MDIFGTTVKKNLCSAIIEKAKDKKSPYLNEDGTFKNGFDGCVEYMQNEEGKSEESAKKICGYINAHKK